MQLRFVLFATLTAAALAQQPDEFQSWMKVTGQSATALNKMEKKAGPEAVAAAERIGAVYESMIGYWRQRNAPDAVKLSEQGKASAVALASAAYSGEETRATAALKGLVATCKPCHDAWRESVGPNKYRIRDQRAETK